jgi:hypothetical protein
VRNPYGYPITPFDGVTLLSENFGDDPTEFLDEVGLVQGAYYYYSLFVYDITQYTWVKTGEAQALSVKRLNNQTRLWDYLPDVYKLSTVTSHSVTSDNVQLQNFLNLFGFWLDGAQTTIDLLLERYNTQKVNATLLPLMLKQFGFTYEPEIGAQQSRVLLRDAVQLQKEKGSVQGLKEYVKSFSGYSLSSAVDGAALPSVEGLVIGHNLMLDYNDSSFEESFGHWSPASGTKISRVGISKISKVSISSNVATLTIGSHGFSIGDKISVTDCLPIFNTGLLAFNRTVTAISATTVSFSLTASDLSERKVTTGYISPFPLPWEETSAPANFPNKKEAILSVSKSTSGSGTASLKCVGDSPIDSGIPVTAGQTYSFSFQCGSTSTTRDFTASIIWYDRFGTLISTSNGSALISNLDNLTARPFVSAAAPTSAFYAVPSISIASVAGSSAEHHYIDACQFEKAAAPTEFDEARNIHITLKANRINELINPQFANLPSSPWKFSSAGSLSVTSSQSPLIKEPGSDTWGVLKASLSGNYATLILDKNHHLQIGETISVVGVGAPYDGVQTVFSKTALSLTFAKTNADLPIADVTGEVFHASSAIKVGATFGSSSSSSQTIVAESAKTSADYMPIYYPDSSYTFSVYFQAVDAPVNAIASIYWYDSSKTLISSTLGDTTSSSTGWNRANVISTAPANAAYAKVQLSAEVLKNDTIYEVYVDSALFERSSFVLDYFDGDAENENVALEDVFWEGGSPNEGRSHFYKNRVSTLYRLTATLPDFLTAGSTFALYLAQPNT